MNAKHGLIISPHSGRKSPGNCAKRSELLRPEIERLRRSSTNPLVVDMTP